MVVASDLEELKTAPVERLVNAILLVASKKRATHIRAIAEELGGSVQLFIDGAWEHEIDTPQLLHTPIVRRLGVMIGVLPPKRGEPKFGRICLEIANARYLYFLVAVERTDELSALVEVVDEATFVTGRQPRPPSPHPYRQS